MSDRESAASLAHEEQWGAIHRAEEEKLANKQHAERVRICKQMELEAGDYDTDDSEDEDEKDSDDEDDEDDEKDSDDEDDEEEREQAREERHIQRDYARATRRDRLWPAAHAAALIRIRAEVMVDMERDFGSDSDEYPDIEEALEERMNKWTTASCRSGVLLESKWPCFDEFRECENRV